MRNKPPPAKRTKLIDSSVNTFSQNVQKVLSTFKWTANRPINHGFPLIEFRRQTLIDLFTGFCKQQKSIRQFLLRPQQCDMTLQLGYFLVTTWLVNIAEFTPSEIRIRPLNEFCVHVMTREMPDINFIWSNPKISEYHRGDFAAFASEMVKLRLKDYIPGTIASPTPGVVCF